MLQSSIVLLGLKQDGKHCLPPGSDAKKCGVGFQRKGLDLCNIQMLDDFVQGSLNYRFGEIQRMQIDPCFLRRRHLKIFFSPFRSRFLGDMQYLQRKTIGHARIFPVLGISLNDLHFRFSITEVKACYQLESKIFRMFPMGWEGSVAAGMDTPSPSAKTAEVGKFICGHRQLKKLHCATWT